MTDARAEIFLRQSETTILGGSTAPPWLAPKLRQMAATITAWRVSEANAPTRKEMRARLDAFRDAVAVLKDGLTDPVFEVFLGRDWMPAGGPTYQQWLACFDELSIRANNKTLRLAGQGGSAFAFPTDRDQALTAQELCAWTVKHAMLIARPIDVVGPDLPDAHDAANQLWQAAGGQPLGSRDGSRRPTGWREHFITLSAAEDPGDRRSGWLASMLSTFCAQSLAPFDDSNRT